MGLRILKSKRVLHGLTQVEFAAKLGMDTRSYNLKENGKREFSVEDISKVSKILGLSLNEINDIFLHLDI
ncbi:MAG: helix-turn-helix transcriptional regulator [Paraclostridium sp.]